MSLHVPMRCDNSDVPPRDYYEYVGRDAMRQDVVYGPYFNVPATTPEGMADPFSRARPFAYALRKDTSQHYVWGWYSDGAGVHAAICPAEVARKYLTTIEGATYDRS
jgi:hypothetical protein